MHSNIILPDKRIETSLTHTQFQEMIYSLRDNRKPNFEPTTYQEMEEMISEFGRVLDALLLKDTVVLFSI